MGKTLFAASALMLYALTGLSQEPGDGLRPLWGSDEGEGGYVRALGPAGDGLVLLGAKEEVRSVRAETGAVVWRREGSGLTTRAVLDGKHLVLVNADGVTAVSPDTGELVWKVLTGAVIRAVGGRPGAVFILMANFLDPEKLELWGMESATGKVVWHRALEGEAFDLLLVAEDAVGVALRHPAGVTFFEAESGAIRFSARTSERNLYREPFLVDGTKLIFGHGNRRLEARDAKTGSRLWEKDLGLNRSLRSATPAPGGVLVSDTAGRLLLLEADTGEMRWEIPPEPEAPLQYKGECADEKQVCVVRRRESDSVYFVAARDLRNGERRWRADLVASKSATPDPLRVGDDIAYHVNSYDFGRSRWESRTILISRETGAVRQRIAPEALQGVFTYARFIEGTLCLFARGGLRAFGPP